MVRDNEGFGFKVHNPLVGALLMFGMLYFTRRDSRFAWCVDIGGRRALGSGEGFWGIYGTSRWEEIHESNFFTHTTTHCILYCLFLFYQLIVLIDMGGDAFVRRYLNAKHHSLFSNTAK